MSQQYANAAHPHTAKNPHVWGKPMPGQGRFDVCKKCGIKKTPRVDDPLHPDSSCTGKATPHRPTKSEYDPYA